MKDYSKNTKEWRRLLPSQRFKIWTDWGLGQQTYKTVAAMNSCSSVTVKTVTDEYLKQFKTQATVTTNKKEL